MGKAVPPAAQRTWSPCPPLTAPEQLPPPRPRSLPWGSGALSPAESHAVSHLGFSAPQGTPVPVVPVLIPHYRERQGSSFLCCETEQELS